MVVVDAGHGGVDSGATGNGIIEKDLNLKISNYMYQRFKDLKIPVYATRTTDETISPEKRVELIKNAFGDRKDVIVISNHINSGGASGAEVIYALRNTSTLAKSVLNEIGLAGQIMRKYYQRRLPGDTMKDYYFIHRNTGVTQPILVEYGFLDNATDAQRLKSNYKKYAEAVVKAVANYKRVPYLPPLTPDTYIVQKGDSLYSISNKSGVSVAELKRLNNLTSDTLTVGQTLILTSKIEQVQSDVYFVAGGDSLYSIARRFNTTVDALIKLNNLKTTTLTLGQKLLITPTAIVTPPIESENVYIVKSGDSLYTIAETYGTTISELRALNNLTSDTLVLGQKVLLPSTNTTYITHIVKSGDNLYSIATMYNVTVEAIKKANNLISNLLSLNQKLLIPK